MSNPQNYIQYSDELTPRTEGEKAAYLEGVEEGKRQTVRDDVAAPTPVADSGAITDERIVEIGMRHFREGHDPKAITNFVAAVREVLAAAKPVSVATATTAAVGDGVTFEQWAINEGLISESHGVRFVNSMCDVARKAWQAARASMPERKVVPAAYMVRHIDFRDSETPWRAMETKFFDKYMADPNYDMRTLYEHTADHFPHTRSEMAYTGGGKGQELIEIALKHSWETGSHAFMLPVPNTMPKLYVVMGEADQINRFLPCDKERAAITNDQIDDLWLYRKDLHNGELMPQLRDFARALLATTASDSATPQETGD